MANKKLTLNQVLLIINTAIALIAVSISVVTYLNTHTTTAKLTLDLNNLRSDFAQIKEINTTKITLGDEDEPQASIDFNGDTLIIGGPQVED